jgi:hypothetical protein
VSASSTTQKAVRKKQKKSTAADNNNGEKSQSRNGKNERSTQVGRTNPQTKTTNQIEETTQKYRQAIPESGPMNGPKGEPEETRGSMKYRGKQGEQGTEFQRNLEKSASCMARFMKDMQYATWAELLNAKAMIMAHCFIRVCRKTQVVNHGFNDHGMCSRAQFGDSVK